MTASARQYDFPVSVRWISGRRTVAASLDLPVHLELEVGTAPLVEATP